MRHLPIAGVKIDRHTGWLNDHLRGLESNYHNSPYYYYYIDDLQDLLSQEYSNLHDAIWNSAAFEFCQNTLWSVAHESRIAGCTRSH